MLTAPDAGVQIFLRCARTSYGHLNKLSAFEKKICSISPKSQLLEVVCNFEFLGRQFQIRDYIIMLKNPAHVETFCGMIENFLSKWIF